MPEIIEIPNGKLNWKDQAIDDISFRIEIEKSGSISIHFDPLIFDTAEKHTEGMGIFDIFQEIHLKRSRRVLKFCLSGRSQDGVEITTSHARLTNGSKYELGSPLILKPVATADELLCTYPAASTALDEIDACVEYLTRGQLGGVGGDRVEVNAGTVFFSATCKLGEAKNLYGALSVEKRIARADLDQWIEECNEVAERALHLLSIAQGRWYNWTARIVYRQLENGCEKLRRCVRPMERRDAVRAHLFHHLNLGAPLELLKTTYTRELIQETGIDTALLLMLTSTPYTEGRMWNQLVALEHLLTRFEPKLTTTIEKQRFKDEIRPHLYRALERAMEDAGFSVDGDELKILKSRVAGINGPTLYSKFRQFVEHYQVPIKDLDEDDVRFVVTKCRNDLAHQGIPTSIGDDLDRLYLLADLAEELLNRIVMAMLSYEGHFVSAFDQLEHYWFSKEEGVRLLNPGTAG